jgi:hypothetical protein
MSIQHKTRTGKIYYLHVTQNKRGKPRYHFSMDPEGELAQTVPEGFEVYENIRGQVFLRRKVARIFTEEELAMVQEALEHQSGAHSYQTEVKKNAIIVHEAEDYTARFQSLATPWLNRERLEDSVRESANYQAVMRFVLVDSDKRLFSAERFCFRGSVDDWIPISQEVAPLRAHLKKFIRHLGTESFFELSAWS